LSGAPNAPPVTIKLELGVGLQHGPSAFARIGGAGSVYEVDSSILAELSVDPLFYRARLLRDLPAGAQITHVKLTDNVTKAVIFDQAISSDPKDAALQPLRKDLQTLRAKKFVLGTFSPTVKIEGEDRPWKYLLEATATPAGGTGGAQASLTSIFLSERVGGTTQYAGSPEFSAIWKSSSR
jgi:hypothetical protein